METFKSIGKTNRVTQQNFNFSELRLGKDVVYKICQTSVVGKWFKCKFLQRDLEKSLKFDKQF